jgi:hypothetical protein
MRDAPILRVSPFSSYWRCTYYRRVSHFIAKGDVVLVACLARYGSLVPPRLLELILTTFKPTTYNPFEDF